MKFTCNTKSLADALTLGVVSSNISKFYMKSSLAQLSVGTSDTLVINLEATGIYSELKVVGHWEDENKDVKLFVDNQTLKQLISSIDTNAVTLEFGNGLTVSTGVSKFTLPKVIDEDIDLIRPSIPNPAYPKNTINLKDWKFVKDHQMYALATSFINPIYTKVWIGAEDVLVGDFNNGIYTHSQISLMPTPCLVADTIVNLFNSLPEGATIRQSESGYVIEYESSPFTYLAEFIPQHEGDENVGNYYADDILSMMDKDYDNAISMEVSTIKRFLSQAAIVDSKNVNAESTIVLELKENNKVSLHTRSVDCNINAGGSCPTSYSLTLRTDLLKSMISKFTEETINICPMFAQPDDETASDTDSNSVVGIVVWDSQLTTVLAGVD